MARGQEPLLETQGDTFSKTISFTDSDGNGQDITGWTLYVTVKEEYEDADNEAVLSTDVTTHDNATNGETSFTFPASETESLDGPYFFEVKYEDTTGTVETVISRVLEFTNAVRKSTQ